MIDLKDWAFKNSPFLKISDGETIEAEFVEDGEVVDNFNPEKKKIQYTLSIKGVKKFLASGSAATAMFMATIKPREMIAISKTGEGQKSRYKYKKVEKIEKTK